MNNLCKCGEEWYDHEDGDAEGLSLCLKDGCPCLRFTPKEATR